MSKSNTDRHTQSFPEGTLITSEGDEVGDLYIIESGVAEVFREREGKKLILARLGAGEMIGVMTVLDGGPRTASVRARTDVNAVVIKKDQIKRLVKDLPGWATSFMGDLVLRVKQANDLYQNTLLGHFLGLEGCPHLSMAATISHKFFQVAKKAAGEKKRSLEVDEVLELLAKEENLPFDSLKKIIAIFDEWEISPWTNADRRCSVGKLGGFPVFSEYLDDLCRDAKLDAACSVMPRSNRHALQQLAQAARGDSRLEDGYLTLSYGAVGEIMVQTGHDRIDSNVFKQAHFLNLLVDKKSNNSNTIHFSPELLKGRLQVLEAIIAIDRLESPHDRLEMKRTLVY